MKITRRPSPNFGERRGCDAPDMVVLHYTAMDSAEAACRTLCNPETEVSAHYLIAENGAVTQLVEEDCRAWHAGAGSWGGDGDINSRSIGIELANTGFAPFAAPLMDALEALLSEIADRWRIAPERVIGHSDMAPGRKIDPGKRFDWHRLARHGHAVWPDWERVGPASDAFHAALVKFGYPEDVAEDTRLAAFRLRFNPGETRADPTERDMGMAQALARGDFVKFA